MAISRQTLYPTQTLDETGYPGGKAKNKANADDVTATPFSAAWVNDLWGFLDAFIARTNLTRSGTPDTCTVSQHMQALDLMMRAWIMYSWQEAPSDTGLTFGNGAWVTDLPILAYKDTGWDHYFPTPAEFPAGAYLEASSVASNPRLIIPIEFPTPHHRATGINIEFENSNATFALQYARHSRGSGAPADERFVNLSLAAASGNTSVSIPLDARSPYDYTTNVHHSYTLAVVTSGTGLTLRIKRISISWVTEGVPAAWGNIFSYLATSNA